MVKGSFKKIILNVQLEAKGKELSRRESIVLDNGYSVASSREGSPTSGTSKEPLKLLISRTASISDVSSVSPKSSGIKLKFKKQHVTGQK